MWTPEQSIAHGMNLNREDDMLRTIVLIGMVTVFGSGVVNAQQKIEIKGLSAKIKLNQVVSGYLSELNGKYQLRLGEVILEPGGRLGPHHHAGPGIRCVTAGELTFVAHDDKTTIYKVGDCFYESGDVSHSGDNASDKPLVMLIFEILPTTLSGPSILPVPALK
jgi:quercetin dioxygenase-like cupin family protein